MGKSFAYVPMIKWKAGEYKALKNLDEGVKRTIHPLIQLVPPGYDFERKVVKRTIDQQLSSFADDYYKNWGERGSFLDFNLIDPTEKMADGRAPTEYIFDVMAQRGTPIVPVTSTDRHPHYQSAVSKIIQTRNTGVCIRLSLTKAYSPQIIPDIRQLLSQLNLSTNDADLIIDMESPENFEPIAGFATGISMFLKNILAIGKWRTSIICGSSFPQSMAMVTAPYSILPRQEWKLYKALRPLVLQNSSHKIIFGDYGIVHPRQPEALDPRKINQAAAIKYAIDDSWVIYRGRGLRKFKNNGKKKTEPGAAFDEGHAQYFRLCKELKESQYFMGEVYSVGDKKIYDTANLTSEETENWTKKSGSPTTWLEACMNHHFTKVVSDLSSLGAV